MTMKTKTLYEMPPDNANVWKFLLDNGVDLINTDRLKEFREFIVKYNSSRKSLSKVE